MSEQTCPPEHAWMPLLAGEPVAGEVQTHLDSCTTCRARVHRMQAGLAELRSFSDTTDHAAAPARPVRPATVGKYLVVGALDTGGQAEVYRALHPVLDKEVVIKLGHVPVEEGSMDRHLLVTEGKLLASLEDPNLAQVFDLDFHEGRPYLVMEFVRGRNLLRWAEEDEPEPREAARVIAAAARALAVVHRHGIIHQDIKPHNILIDETGEPRLIDFGLARLGHAWTGAGQQPSGGTPAYMAPEQARGQAEQISPRSDIFALGGVLYELLTAKPPFASGTLDETLARAGRCDFDRDALKAPYVAPDLAAICLKAMAANPAERHATAEDLAGDLERWLDRPRRMNRLLAVAVGVLGLALGLGASLWWHRPDPKPVVEQLPAPTPAAAPMQELVIQFVRGEALRNLADALPIHTQRDALRVRGTVPPGSRPVLFLASQDGSVERLKVEVSPGDTLETLVFPQEGRATLTGEGTEIVLLLAGPRDEQALHEVEKLLKEGGGWPRVPQQVYMEFDRERIRALTTGGRPLGETRPDPASEIERRLDKLRLRLRERFDVVLGAAFSHQPVE